MIVLRQDKIELEGCSIFLEIRTVVPHLKRVFGEQGISLLIEHKWLWGLIKSMLIKNTLNSEKSHLSDEEMASAKAQFLQERGYESEDGWEKCLQDSDEDESSLVLKLRKKVEYKKFLDTNYSSKAEAQFLDRKNDLDNVVYSLLRLGDKFIAQELYLQIESGDSSFADLARKFSEGPEKETNGIVGPVSLTSAHPQLAERLRVSSPGVLLEPFRVSDWWLVVRLENYSPAHFDEKISFKMCHELFKGDVERQADADLIELQDFVRKNGLSIWSSRLWLHG